MIIYKPTYLYIKQHSVTCKLYFGKTTKSNPEKYLGSGTHWVKHIKKHGKEHVITLWYCLFYDQEECTKFALLFSKQENIIESQNWLNQTYETGTGGGCLGRKLSDETKMKIRIKAIGRKHTQEQKLKIGNSLKGRPNRNIVHSDATKMKMSTSHTGRTHSNETKLKQSLSAKERWQKLKMNSFDI